MLQKPLHRVGLEFTACKCCGTPSPLFGVVDFHKNCEQQRGRDVLELSGVPLYYHRCPSCGFVFTIAFDHFTQQDFKEYIYNEDYALVDPDYLEDRPRSFAQLLYGFFSQTPQIRLLEYGGGTGQLVNFLRDAGFNNVDTYDPYVPRYAVKPTCTFDCVVCFEVVEHAANPKHIFEDLASLVADQGLVIFSTLLLPEDIDKQGVNWWYIAPRNGHISLFSRPALEDILTPLGVQFLSFNENLHIFYRTIPDFAAHLFQVE